MGGAGTFYESLARRKQMEMLASLLNVTVGAAGNVTEHFYGNYSEAFAGSDGSL